MGEEVKFARSLREAPSPEQVQALSVTAATDHGQR